MTVHGLKDGTRINWGYNFDTACNKFTTGLKYFTPEGLILSDTTTHIRTPQHLHVRRSDMAMAWGPASGLDCKCVCSGELNHASCLHNRPPLHCGKTLTWSSSCLADGGVWRWVCVHWEMAWRRLPCSTSPAPCTCQCNKSQQLQQCRREQSQAEKIK